jgi:hypothetical protein
VATQVPATQLLFFGQMSARDVRRGGIRVSEATGNPCFGLLVPRFVSPVTFHALGYAILASPNFRAVFQRLIRFQRLISDATEQRLERVGDRYRLVIERLSPLGPPHEGIDAFMATGVRTLRGLSQSAAVNPLALYLRRPEPRPSDLFHKIFRCPIHFDAALDAAEYSRKHVEASLSHANAELAKHGDAIVSDYLARTGRIGTLADRVHALLVEHLPDGGPSEATIAQYLSMSSRNLQLQLAQEANDVQSAAQRRASRSRAQLPATRQVQHQGDRLSAGLFRCRDVHARLSPLDGPDTGSIRGTVAPERIGLPLCVIALDYVRAKRGAGSTQ